jgi:hypothetical protein
MNLDQTPQPVRPIDHDYHLPTIFPPAPLDFHPAQILKPPGIHHTFPFLQINETRPLTHFAS